MTMIDHLEKSMWVFISWPLMDLEFRVSPMTLLSLVHARLGLQQIPTTSLAYSVAALDQTQVLLAMYISLAESSLLLLLPCIPLIINFPKCP